MDRGAAISMCSRRELRSEDHGILAAVVPFMLCCDHNHEIARRLSLFEDSV
jgi:hypothetical protein